MSAEGNTYYLIKSNVHYTKAKGKGIHAERSSKIIARDIFGDMNEISKFMSIAIASCDVNCYAPQMNPVKISNCMKYLKFTALEYRFEGSKIDDGKYAYKMSIHERAKMVKSWSFTTERPIDASQESSHMSTNTDLSKMCCAVEQTPNFEEVLPFEVSVCGQLMTYKIPESSGVSFRYNLYADNISDLSYKWLVLMAWGANAVHKRPGPTSKSANCFARFCYHNFGEFFELQQQIAKELKTAPELDLEDIVGLDQIRLILLTMHGSAQLIFKFYGAEIDRVEARLSKSRKKASANLLQLWRSIRDRMEIVVAFPEEEILSMSSQEISKLVQNIALKLKGDGRLIVINILDMALKKIHPLDNRLQQYVAQTTSADLMEQLRDTSKSFFNRNYNYNNNIKPYWMKHGWYNYISSLIRVLILGESSRIIVQKPTGKILRVSESYPNFVSILPGIYLISMTIELKLYYEETKMAQVIVTFTKETFVKVLGSCVRKSAIYILVKKDKSNFQSLLELREIVIPLDPLEPVKMTLLEDDVEKTWHGMVKKDKLIMIDMNQNLMRTYKLSSNSVKASEKKLYLEPSADSTDAKLNTLHEILKKASVYFQPKFDISSTHLGCVIEKSAFQPTEHSDCFFAVSLSEVESPAVHFEKFLDKDYYAKTRIVTSFQSGHIASILIRHNNHTVNMVTFKNSKFQEFYRLKHMASIKSVFETNKLHDTNPSGGGTLIFDGATQRIKIYYRQTDDAGKMNIRMKALKIIV